MLMLLVSVMLIDVFKTIINKSFKESFDIIFMENIKSKVNFFFFFPSIEVYKISPKWHWFN